MSRYRERMVPPTSWYLIAFTGVGSMMVAALFSAGPQLALGIGIVGVLLTGGLLWWQAALIEVSDSGTLRVGRSHLEQRYRGEVRPLDIQQTRALMGRDADPRAWLATRPYLNRAVQIMLDDSADPHPYWLVGSRTPNKLAHALTSTSVGQRS